MSETPPPTDHEMERIPVFTTEDPLLPVVTELLDQHPDQAKSIRALFATKVPSVKEQIVGVRSEDVLTLIYNLLQESTPVDYTDPAVAKEAGWYYITPVSQDNINANIRENKRQYAKSAAFTAAFMRNVKPVLVPDWIGKARILLKNLEEFTDSDSEHYPDALVVEAIIDLFYTQIYLLRQGNNPIPNLEGARHNGESSTLQELAGLIQSGIDKHEVVRFLAEVADTREGVLVAFNESIMQGPLASDSEYADDIIHDANEQAIRPKRGEILLAGAVVAIESLGDYEDNVLKQLGLWSE